MLDQGIHKFNMDRGIPENLGNSEKFYSLWEEINL